MKVAFATLGCRVNMYESEAMTEKFIDRKSTRLNSSHANISYAVFCLKKTIEARQEKPHRKALGGPQRLDALTLGQHAFGDDLVCARNASRARRPSTTLCNPPFRLLTD